MNTPQATVEAVVTAVIGSGERAYVVVRLNTALPDSKLEAGTTVTFSLSEWSGRHGPKRGQVVILSDIEKFKDGWRARSASPVCA